MELDKFQHKWIMLDGPLDPKWFESMNSILDDNQILTLANGDRIRMGPHMKLLFETSDLSNVTASTVTRLGVINFSISNSYINNKISSFISNFNDNVKEQLELLRVQILNRVLDEFNNFDLGIPINKSEFLHSFLWHFMESTTRCKFEFSKNLEEL